MISQIASKKHMLVKLKLILYIQFIFIIHSLELSCLFQS